MNRTPPVGRQREPDDSRDREQRSPTGTEKLDARPETDTFESNGSTGDQIGGQSPYAEDELLGRKKGLPKR